MASGKIIPGCFVDQHGPLNPPPQLVSLVRLDPENGLNSVHDKAHVQTAAVTWDFLRHHGI